MDSDDSCSYVGHMVIHEDPDSPDNGQDSRHEGQQSPGDVDDSSDKMIIVGIIHEVEDAADQAQDSAHEGQESPDEAKDAADQAQDSAHEGQESSDSAYEAETVIDSPTSTSSTFQLNLSLDSNDQNEVNDNNLDEDEVQMLEELPPAVVAAAAARAAHPIIIRNFDETGFQYCAMHSFKHLTSSCSGCACRCKATNIDGIVVDSESEEDEDPGFYALLADLHERDEEDEEREDEEREDEDAELPALVVNLVHNEHSEDDSQEDIFFRN